MSWGRRGQSQRRCETLLLCRQRAPAVPEVKALVLLKLGSSSAEELRSVVPLPVWFKAGSGLAIILLVRSAVWGRKPSWRNPATVQLKLEWKWRAWKGVVMHKKRMGKMRQYVSPSPVSLISTPGGHPFFQEHCFLCTCHQFLKSYHCPL